MGFSRRLRFFLFPAVVGAAVVLLGAEAVERFPPPDLGPDYVWPHSSQAAPSSGVWAWIDMAALSLFLAVATWLIYRRRSRRAIFWLTVGAVAWFGFWRKGCVCSIGAIQNVAQALFDSGYVLPLVVLFFFVAPLLLALFFGRVFCAAVCPLGAMQELVLLKPLKVPRWLDHGLGTIRFFYLGLAVMLAATGATYLICRYDPFVSFFRMSARFHIWIWSVAILVLAMFVGRPYCRYLCPLGALLHLCSRFSHRRVTITPDKCVVCGLCRDACPYGAIETAVRKGASDSAARRSVRRLALAAALIVALPVSGAWLGKAAAPALAQTHYIVQTAERVAFEEAEGIEERTLQSEAFRSLGMPPETIYNQAREVYGRFAIGGVLFGAWCGLVAALAMAGALYPARRKEYEADRGRCFACGRCYESCPVQRRRWKEGER